ncbi:MAG TPA: SDR family oxidoreductase [Lactobacillaceae bacterium]|jgi:NAD(P)-dependent dehydrogenase (short-subunit alcohol dehydrogenase family)
MSKIAIVTGGSRGIGRATVLEFAGKGVDVIFTYNSGATEAQEVVAAVEALGARAIALQLNVAEQDTFAAFADNVKDALAQLGAEKFDILVNNAGTSNHDKILDITPDALDSLYTVHVKSVVFLTQALTPLQNDGGVIINTSSGLTRLTFAGSGLYGMLKAAVETLTRYMAVEFADRKIRVNVVAPGPIATGFSGLDANTAQQEALSGHTALGRVGQPEDVAKVTVALATDAGEFVTAQRVEVSGGIAL